jgi:hypothetical protein
MIVLDTHIWIWWIHGDKKLPANYSQYLQEQESQGLGRVINQQFQIQNVVKDTKGSMYLLARVLL